MHYHADVPCIISGDTIAYLDPQERVWPRESGKWFALDSFLNSNSLVPFDNIEGFNFRMTKDYSKTLFRFPLRTAPSGLSERVHSVDSICELTGVLKEEAKFLLLFLRSVYTIKISKIKPNGTLTVDFQVQISQKDRDGMMQLLMSQLQKRHLSCQYEISPCMTNVAKFSVEIKDSTSRKRDKTTSWLVANQVGCENDEVLKLAKKQSTFPWVGVAMEVGEQAESSSGRIFCFLPMPVETSSNLPVHVNGTFGLNDDRRTIKWPGGERRNDPSALWNNMLVTHCLPSCYNLLLRSAVEKYGINAEHLYKVLPSIELTGVSQWRLILEPLYRYVFQWNCFWAEECNEWVAVKRATIISMRNERSLSRVVKSTMIDGGHKIVTLPEHILQAALKYYPKVLPMMSPALVRQTLRKYPRVYNTRTRREKLELLRYCLADGNYSDLEDLELIPVANETFETFSDEKMENRNYIYICSNSFPRRLLPNCDHLLIDLKDANMQLSLSSVANSSYTQLVNLDVTHVQYLLSHSFPSNWKEKHVKLSNSNQEFPIKWFPIFWDWIQSYDLSKFENFHVIPIVADKTDSTLTVSRLMVASESSVVIISGNECSKDMLNILHKFDVQCTMQKYVHYLRHSQLNHYVNAYNPRGVLTAISNSNCDLSYVDLDEKESLILQRFLASVNQVLLTQRETTVLTKLRIFKVLNYNEHLSLECAKRKSWNGTLIVEPPEFTFSFESIPRNLVILSRGSNQWSLLTANFHFGMAITFPSSQFNFIIDALIPFIESGKCPSTRINSLMEHVLQLVPILKRRYKPACIHTLTSKLSCLPFIPVDTFGSRKAPKDLYDSSKSELRALFHSKPLFPRPPFDDSDYLKILRECHLQTTVQGHDLLKLLLHEVGCKSPDEPQRVSKQKLLQVKAVINYIKKEPHVLDQFVNAPDKSICTLGCALKGISTTRAWLPICAAPPDDYCKCIPWKGSYHVSHLTSLTKSVVLCSTEQLNTLPHLVGSQVYIVECPSKLSEELCSTRVPIGVVLNHFEVIQKNQRDIDTAELDRLVCRVYGYLQDHLHALQGTCSTSELNCRPYVWLRGQHKFVTPSSVVLRDHSTFSNTSCLYPYYTKLPESLVPYTRLLTYFGVQEKLTDSDIVSILRLIKEDKQITYTSAWNKVEQILNWITNCGTESADSKLAESDTLYIPVKSPNLKLLLVDVKNVVYSDLDCLQSFKDIGRYTHFIHGKFVTLAPYLGAKSLTKHLNISHDAFGDVGQHEPLVTRLRNILREYKGGLTVIKELLQNADDAGATEVSICYDWRTHSNEPQSLIYPGMAKCHGPALLIHNNAAFTDEDFENITKLAGATKMNKSLKIGKFGVGFCSVYHLTDVPSFVSGKWLYIFDPTISYLKKEITDRSRPGKKIAFTEKIVHQTKQLSPYSNLFGFDQSKPYQGTIFRLPLRLSPSEISHVIYNKNRVDRLLKDVQSAGSDLLLFLNNVKKIKIHYFNGKSNKPTILWYYEKSMIYRVPRSNSEGDDSSIYQVAFSNGDKSKDTKEQWLMSHVRHQVLQDSTALGVASVACSLHLHRSTRYTPRRVEGEVFCYLPLALKTGLPVHVSANFAVLGDRSGIHASDNDGSKDEVLWNVTLMKTVIPQAYLSLLLAIKHLHSNQKISFEDTKYYSLWPLEEDLKMHNPWIYCIPPLYLSISTSTLFYSECRSIWLQFEDASILALDILTINTRSRSSPDHECVVDTAKQLNYQLIDLPTSYQDCLPAATVQSRVINENEFLKCFFENIKKVSVRNRNGVLFLCFKVFAFRSESYLEEYLKKNQCIPCSPDGKYIKHCSDVVDPRADFSMLYKESDRVFPVEDFYMDKHVRSSMKELGMIHIHLPLFMIVERARTISTLFSNHRKDTLRNVVIILQCIARLISEKRVALSMKEFSELEGVVFLPVKGRPESYPKCIEWIGQDQTLLCGKKLVRGLESTPMLCGSQVHILNESDVDNGGCGRVTDEIAKALGISSVPSCDLIIKHLHHIEVVYSQSKSTTSLRKWIESVCDHIYGQFDVQLSQNNVSDEDLKELKVTKSVWTGKSFVSPDKIAKSWDRKGPYLYSIPYLLESKRSLLRVMEFKDAFSCKDLVGALECIHAENCGKSINNKKEVMKTVLEILSELVKLMTGSDSTAAEDLVSASDCYIPDTSGILRKVSELAYNDAPWCQVSQDVHFVHEEVPRNIAIQLGVTPIRSKALEEYESTHQHWGGVPFGQHEKLTQRIRNILEEYPHGITLLKEFLQNADDAEATKMYVILDSRCHGTDKLPSNEWVELQGPSLLVWNNSSFSEDDMKGIQQLGLGSKRSNPDTIGQFGIGFNVVYHITDCPSFFTNSNTLCVFDPHCRYVPGANESQPGRRFNVDDGFWSNWSDLRSAYLCQGTITGCPKELQTSGTLFRFPLRCTSKLLERSELVDERSSRIGNSETLMTVKKMKDDLSSWFPSLKEAVLFLNNVTELKLFEIKDNSSMVLTHHYVAELRETAVEKRATFLARSHDFIETSEPIVVNFPMLLVENAPRKCIERWIIQLGIGDNQNPQRHWKYLPHRKPRHGLALSLRPSKFTGRIFCFLPLPSLSSLPVHVNGDFILDSARSGLWMSRDNPGTDDRHLWNVYLLEALATSYDELLVSCRNVIFSSEVCRRLQDPVEKYYNIFPRWLEEHAMDKNMQFLANMVYKKLSDLNSPILIVRSDLDVHSIQPEWLPPIDRDDPSAQVHFWDSQPSVNSVLPNVLKGIGMNLTAAPMFVRRHFYDCGVEIPIADPVTVYKYYCDYFYQVHQSFPCPVTETGFKSVGSFVTFVKYVLQEEQVDEDSHIFSMKFPESPEGVPLLLTSDDILRHFSDDKVVCSNFSDLFTSHCGHKFLHPEMCKLNLNPKHFIEPGESNWDLISGILHDTLPDYLTGTDEIVHDASEFIRSILPQLWECLHSDKVFRVHSEQILREWALFLTTDNKLFACRSDHQLLPVIPLTKRRVASSHRLTMHREPCDFHYSVFTVLEKHGMPVLNKNVVKWDLCKAMCPQISNPPQVLRNLVHLFKRNGLTSLTNGDNDEHILMLLDYFGLIHFAHDPGSLVNIKSLPLFKDINGKYCTLDAEVYIWPAHSIPLEVGREIWMEQTSVVFLSPDGSWNRLGVSSTLGLEELSPLFVYTKFIFPHFPLLSDTERLAHLKHIRDTDSLFDTAWRNHKKRNADSVNIDRYSTDFISALMELRCMRRNDDDDLRPISDFYDPDKPILGLFLDAECFPPDHLISHDRKWLSFFRKLGLRTKPTMEEFVSFCTRVAERKQRNIGESSQVLIEYLFVGSHWHDEEQFLDTISDIPFVCAHDLEDLSWIAPVANVDITVKQHNKTFRLVSLNKAASFEVKDIIWTVKPVITLPCEKLSLLEKSCQIEKFLRCIKVAMKPSVGEVVRHIKNVSMSRFANFQLFDHCPKDCTPSKSRKDLLFDVLVRSFEFLKEGNCAKEQLDALQGIPCIPVYANEGVSPVPVTILVSPLQIVASTDSDGSIKRLVPFLNTLPDGLYSVLPDVLSKLGVATEVHYYNLRNALKIMQHNIQQPLDPNSVEVLKIILKKLYSIEIHPDNMEPLYLPNERGHLTHSTQLLYHDHGRYKRALLDTSQLTSYSFFSLLTTSVQDEHSTYGFTLKEFVSKLPSGIRPLPLSDHSYERLSDGCIPQNRTSDLTNRIKHAFGFRDLPKVIQMILSASDVEASVCDSFITSLSRFCNSVILKVIPCLNVDIYVIPPRDGPHVKIGTAKVDFFLQHDSNFVLYVDLEARSRSNLMESLATTIVSTVASSGEIDIHHIRKRVAIDKALLTLLEDQSSEGIEDLLEDYGAGGHHEVVVHNIRQLSAKLGCVIPECLHHRLYADVHNIFRPQEIVGYELEENYYIFARVCYRIPEIEEGELDRYCIITSEDSEEEIEVTIIELCKILRMKEIQNDSGSKEVVLYDPESEGVRLWEEVKDASLKSILKKIYQELKKIWNITDMAVRRKAIKAMYLKWHPDKNPSQFATKAFQYLQHQIERLERGLDLQLPEDCPYETELKSDIWTNMTRPWEQVFRRRREEQRREETGRSDPSMSDLDEEVRANSVTVDPSKAQVWWNQAQHDLTALQVLMREANTRGEVCAHVCFMAHQVAEKALKAGMYKLIGLHPSVLRWHQLVGHAGAIEQVKPRKAAGLRNLVKSLESFYLDTRFPNRYTPDKVPSEQYSLEDAKLAEKTAKEVMKVVKRVF